MRSQVCNCYGIVAIMTCVAAPTKAAVVTIGASQDNSIFQNAPNNSLGGGQAVFAGTNGNSSPRRGLIAFDIAASVPAGATITGAQLTLYLIQAAGSGMGGGSGEFTIGLYPLAANWGEGTTGSATTGPSLVGNGFAAAEGDATWNARLYSATTPTIWAVPGGSFAASASSTTAVGTIVNASYTWASTPTLIADVQGWLNSPDTNFGWLLRNNNESSAQSFRAFWSREASRTPANAQFVPQLQISYTLAPEPGTAIALVLLLMPPVLRNRWR